MNKQFSEEEAQIHEWMFNIHGHQGNANQNDTEISSHHNHGYHQEFKPQILAKMKGKRNPYTLLIGM
jgi:hypothetical protein